MSEIFMVNRTRSTKSLGSLSIVKNKIRYYKKNITLANFSIECHLLNDTHLSHENQSEYTLNNLNK